MNDGNWKEAQYTGMRTVLDAYITNPKGEKSTFADVIEVQSVAYESTAYCCRDCSRDAVMHQGL